MIFYEEYEEFQEKIRKTADEDILFFSYSFKEPVMMVINNLNEEQQKKNLDINTTK